jgi:hypothetical protein
MKRVRAEKMMDQFPKRLEQQWLAAATSARNIFRADTPRVGDFDAIREWVDERALRQTWAGLIRQSFQTHADPLVACCQAGRALVNDYYSRPPLFHECVSDIIKNSLGEIIGGALFVTLQAPVPEIAKPIKSGRR